MKRLCIYYGWPSLINGAQGNLDRAVRQFNRYGMVVLGDGLQDESHPEHEATRAIVQRLKGLVFGYIDIGVSTQNLPVNEIAYAVLGWVAVGVSGILLDDFGCDFGVFPERARNAVEAVRDWDLRVLANAWNPEDCLEVGLGPNDFILAESWPVKDGVLDPDWEQRACNLAAVSWKTGSPVVSIATGPYDRTLFRGSWQAAKRWGHWASGWGEPGYSADSQAPWRRLWP